MSAPLFLGVDPGSKGAAVILNADSEQPDDFLFAESGPAVIAAWLRNLKPSYAVIEKVGAMPGQGVTSMFTFGEQYGIIQGVLIALQIPHALVPPQTWRKEVGLILPAKYKRQGRAARTRAVKEATVQAAIRRWPVMAETLQKVKNWPIADALWIAECARRRMLAAESGEKQP